MSSTPEQPADLEHRLYALTQAENPATYATNHGLTVREESVKVVIELKQGRSLPSGYNVSVELRQDGLIQGYVPITNLVPLASHDNVSYVRPPQQPATTTET